MTEPDRPEPEVEQTVTAWHPMLVALLEYYLPAGWQLVPELLLTRLPQRVDIVVLRLADTTTSGSPARASKARKILSIFDHLRPHTLIEHKGPTDDLDAGDALTLLGYGAQYMRLKGVSDPSEMCLMVVCDRIPAAFEAQVIRLGGTFEKVGGGLWQGSLAGMLLHGVETREAYRAGRTEHLLYAFCRAYLRDVRAILPLEGEDLRVYDLLYQQVAQFRRQRGDMSIKDVEAAEKSFEEAYKLVLSHFTPEERLAGLTPEERLAGLTPEEVLRALTPEKLLQALTPEQRAELAKKLAH